MPNIQLNNVYKEYDSSQSPAVKALNLDIQDGEFMCLLGPSGCGKTTTLRMIAGLENVSSGAISLGEHVVDSLEQGLFVPPEKRELGLVFQSYALWPHLTVFKNIEFGLKLRKVVKSERNEIIQTLAKKLSIEPYLERLPSQLSGGQQQRVALARMLAVRPNILLMDEPLSNLDARLRLDMRNELKRIHEEFKTTIVFVTHDQWEAMALATKIAVMNNGELQQFGTPEDIYERPANRFVAEFVGTPPINMLDIESDNQLTTKLRTYLSPPALDKLSNGTIGIRPERIQISTQSASNNQPNQMSVDAQLVSILPTGGSWILEVDIGGLQLLITTQTPPIWQQGETIYLVVNLHDLYFFNELGTRIESEIQQISSTCVA
ncbi:ABC transporter ATP-binding protein [Vibrio sp. FNV 38]|nr:ABC transporter ATP-binding protein [Vibrio sp. FNV 38]